MHIENLVTRLRQFLPTLYHVRHMLDLKSKKMLYYAWIESLLRYGIEVYGFAANSYINRLQKAQNKIIKTLFKNSKKLKTIQLFTELNILTITQLRDYVTVYNNYFSQKFKTVSQSKIQFLRKTTYRYTVPFSRNEYGKRVRQSNTSHI